jgi:hypothetical protein
MTISTSICRLECALERIAYLENKIKMQSEEHEDDFDKFVQVLGNSKEKFQEIFGGKGNNLEVDKESVIDSTMEDMSEMRK